MAIKRKARPTSNFYLLDNSIAQDKDLSFAARGMLISLLVKPDNWEISVAALSNETKNAIGKHSGRDAVYAILNELIAAGYIFRSQQRDGSGTMGEIDYFVSEIKQKKESEPLTEKPYTANPTQTNTNLKLKLKEELQPTPDPQTEAARPAIRSSFSFDPNSLEIELGIMSKTESKGVKEYLARALETQETAQIVLDEVVGKIRAGKAAGHDKPIKTIVGYTTTIIARLNQGGFVESHALSERTRREKLVLIEKSKAEFVQKQPTPESAPPTHRTKKQKRQSYWLVRRLPEEIFAAHKKRP